MKVCPCCSLSNEEHSTVCLLCNTSLADAPSASAADLNRPGFAKRSRLGRRRQLARWQIGGACVFYSAIITLTAAYPGYMSDRERLLLFCGSSVVVIFAVLRGFVGQLAAGLLQGVLSLLLVLCFGAFGPFIFLMFVAHIVVPLVFWHGVATIDGADR